MLLNPGARNATLRFFWWVNYIAKHLMDCKNHWLDGFSGSNHYIFNRIAMKNPRFHHPPRISPKKFIHIHKYHHLYMVIPIFFHSIVGIFFGIHIYKFKYLKSSTSMGITPYIFSIQTNYRRASPYIFHPSFHLNCQRLSHMFPLSIHW